MASNVDLALSDLGRVLASGYEENGSQRTHSRRSQANGQEYENASLPKADGGKDAWLFLAGCFCIEALTWGECIYLLHLYLAPTPSVPPFMSKKAVTMTLNISEDSLSLSVYFKNIIPRMRPFPRNHPASLSLVLRLWYDFSMIYSFYPNIICPTNTRLFY